MNLIRSLGIYEFSIRIWEIIGEFTCEIMFSRILELPYNRVACTYSVHNMMMFVQGIDKTGPDYLLNNKPRFSL